MQIVRVSLDNGDRAVGLKLHKMVVEHLKEQLRDQQEGEGMLWGSGSVGKKVVVQLGAGGLSCSSCVLGDAVVGQLCMGGYGRSSCAFGDGGFMFVVCIGRKGVCVYVYMCVPSFHRGHELYMYHCHRRVSCQKQWISY